MKKKNVIGKVLVGAIIVAAGAGVGMNVTKAQAKDCPVVSCEQFKEQHSFVFGEIDGVCYEEHSHHYGTVDFISYTETTNIENQVTSIFCGVVGCDRSDEHTHYTCGATITGCEPEEEHIHTACGMTIVNCDRSDDHEHTVCSVTGCNRSDDHTHTTMGCHSQKNTHGSRHNSRRHH